MRQVGLNAFPFCAKLQNASKASKADTSANTNAEEICPVEKEEAPSPVQVTPPPPPVEKLPKKKTPKTVKTPKQLKPSKPPKPPKPPKPTIQRLPQSLFLILLSPKPILLRPALQVLTAFPGLPAELGAKKR